jgi:hypothetical protein
MNLLKYESIGILGGDVYKIECNRLISLPDSWSFEPESHESANSYNIRSKLETINFIQNYRIKDDENIYFSITFTEKII